jgi:hypothetical protein
VEKVKLIDVEKMRFINENSVIPIAGSSATPDWRI